MLQSEKSLVINTLVTKKQKQKQKLSSQSEVASLNYKTQSKHMVHIATS